MMADVRRRRIPSISFRIEALAGDEVEVNTAEADSRDLAVELRDRFASALEVTVQADGLIEVRPR